MSSLADIQARLAARKRAAAEPSLGKGDGKETLPAKRWKRKGEIDSAAAKAYRDEQNARKEAREEKLSREEEDLRKRNGLSKDEVEGGTPGKSGNAIGGRSGASGDAGLDDARGGRAGSASIETNEADGEKVPPLEKADVVRKLRALGEPATYYGETDWSRFRRLRNLNLKREAEGHGQKNVFQDKMREIERLDAVRQAHEYAGAEYVEGNADGAGRDREAHDQSGRDGGRSGPAGEWDTEGDRYEEEASCPEESVLREIRWLVSLWQRDVDDMSAEVRRTNKGRTAMVTLEQTKEWLKPLNRQLRKRRLPPKILSALVTIFGSVRKRDYLKANNAYYEELAIGKAPWPMGATMVGIHARAAREKIGEGKIAHVMNDEQSRKYIQAVKRLISLSQKHFP